MNAISRTNEQDRFEPDRMSAMERGCRKLLLALLGQVKGGVILLSEGGQSVLLGQAENSDLSCKLTVHDGRFYRDVLRGGSIGAAESFIRGRWSVDDLTSLIRIIARNRDVNERIERGFARVRLYFDRLRHLMRRNTQSGSRRNIADHYDLSNEFFATFLDPTMTYSAGIFEDDSDTMEQASIRKYDLICRKLGLGPHDSVLEIGTGWGGFAIHAASNYGCRVVTTTISRRQHDFARQRIHEAGLGEKVELLLEDYRKLPALLEARFDYIVSIEMIEAVGHRYLDEYFGICTSMLKPEGTMLLQSIVIDDRNYDSYRRSVDFIQRYIFPGGCLPSVSAIGKSIARSGDLRISNLQDITGHYARTLQHWRTAFRKNIGRLEELGFDRNFERLWDFYFGYCEAGFREQVIGTVQLLLSRSAASTPGFVPQV